MPRRPTPWLFPFLLPSSLGVLDLLTPGDPHVPADAPRCWVGGRGTSLRRAGLGAALTHTDRSRRRVGSHRTTRSAWSGMGGNQPGAGDPLRWSKAAAGAVKGVGTGPSAAHGRSERSPAAPSPGAPPLRGESVAEPGEWDGSAWRRGQASETQTG